jgi:ATPase subunit of ABC transporter with duplicated ATPase domains
VAREAIETFLLETPATMLVVSHDRRFLDTVCERLWVVDDGRIAPFDGGYRAWRVAVADGWTVARAMEQESRRLRPSTRSQPAGRAGEAPPASRAGEAQPGRRAGDAAARRVPAVLTAATTPVDSHAKKGPRGNGARLSKDAYRRQREAIDAELTRLNLRRNHLQLELSRPAVQANFIELRRVSSELADVETALAVAEDTWLAVEERAP